MARGASGNGNAAIDEHRVAGRALPARLFVLASSCAAVALLATALFFLLHHVGNRLPYGLAVERFNAESESDRPDEGHAKGYKSMFEYCEVSSAMLGGAREASDADKEEALRDAVVLKMLRVGNANWTACGKLEASASAVAASIVKTRYWWGGKALYAIALRWLSVYEIRELTKAATRGAYLLLAASLLLLSPKLLLLATPLVVFGAFFSGIDYWADAANGFPYLWAVLFVAGLSLLMRREVGKKGGGVGAGEVQDDVWAGTVPVYCFAAGTVSSFLWLGDGHTFLAATWIGMVVWFGSRVPGVAARSKRATLCIVLYGAGIVVCYMLGQSAKAMFLGTRVWDVFWNGVLDWLLSAPATETRDTGVSAFLSSSYAVYWPAWLPAHVVPTFIAVFSVAASLGLAVFEARRGRGELLWGVLWIVGIISIGSFKFLVLDHIHYRTARFAFVPLALCMSCLVLSVRMVDWRKSLATRWELPALLIVAGCISWPLAKYELSAVAKMIESVEDARPIIRSTYDVYLDGSRLVYVKEECAAEDVDVPFFLHLYPVDVADLADSRQPHGFDNLDFDFVHFGFRDRRCTALRILPDYDLAAIHTGQYVLEKGRTWEQRIDLASLE